MKLKKTAAFVIAMSMTVGLLSVFPASAALTPATGYLEEILVDESFDSESYSKTLNIENGVIDEGTVNFELSGKSGISLTTAIDTNKTKQYIIDFELGTDAEYTDPWTATFIGARNTRSAAAPWDQESGSWLGITTDKLILWNTYKDNDSWGNDSATNYKVVDNAYDVSDAAFRIIYEGSVAEIYIDAEKTGDYTLLATMGVDSNKCVTITVGEETLTSRVAFNGSQTSRYFSIWNYKELEEDDPLAPKNEESAGTPAPSVPEAHKTVQIGSFKLTKYADLLMTDDQKTELEASKANLSDIVAKYGTPEAVYYDSSVDVEALETLIGKADDMLSETNVLASEYEELATEISAALGLLIDQDVVDKYLARFTGFESTLDDMRADDKYSAETITKIEEAITTAKNVVDADKLTPSMMDEEFNKVASLFASAGVVSSNGIPSYTVSFTDPSYTVSDFSKDWYDAGGADKDSYAVTSEDGALIQWSVPNGTVSGRDTMSLKSKYSNYSAKATLTKRGNSNMTMSVRQTPGIQAREEDKATPNFTGVPGAGTTGTVFIASNGTTFETVYVVVRSATMVSNNPVEGTFSRSVFAYDLTGIPGALSNDNKTATFKIKDMDDVVELYVVTDSGDVRLATVRFSLELTAGKYTKGTLTNDYTGETVEFSNMSISKANEGVVSFTGRFSNFAVKDFELCTNLAPAEDVLVSDGKSDPNTVELKTEDGTLDFTVDEEKKFSVDAQFDNLKTYGKDEYAAGTINVATLSNTTISSELGNDIVSVDVTAGKLKGVKRGSDVLTVTYQGVEKTFTSTAIVTVKDAAYTAPADTEIFEKRIASAVIANDKAFKSLDVDTTVIPVVKYTLPNNDTGYIPDDVYVEYKTSDASVIAYDATNGCFKATGAGVADVWAEITYKAGTGTDSVATAKVPVEVVASGMTPGVSVAASIALLLEKADDKDVTVSEYIEYLDAAIAAGLDFAYGTTDADKLVNAMLIKNEIAELADADADDIKNAVSLALAVREVYDVMIDKDSNADDLRGILFSVKADNKNSIGADLLTYNKLDTTKKSRAALRVYTQLQKKKADKLTASQIVTIMEEVIDAVKKGGGGGAGGVTNETDKNTGGTSFVVPSTPVTPDKTEGKPLLAGDAAIAVADKFADINDAAWAKEAIGALAYEGVVSGYEDGSIRPNAEITRDEFVKLLVCALGIEVDANATVNYSDIAAGSWQIPYVAAATLEGIVSGTGTLKFGSGETITRQDMATMIYRAVLKFGVKIPNEKLVAFKDAEMIAGYATDAVNALAAAGVVSGMGEGAFAPGACATRAQAIVMIYNIRVLMQ